MLIFKFSISVCFKVFDKDHDGKLNSEDITDMMAALNTVLEEYKSPTAGVSVFIIWSFHIC